MRVTIRLVLFALLLGSAVAFGGGDKLERSRDAAMERYHAGDYAGFVARMEPLAQQSRWDQDLYNLACGYALLGQSERALQILEDLVSRGSDYGFVSDSDFASLRPLPAFASLVGLAAYYEEVNRRLEPVREAAMELYSEGRHAAFVQVMEEVAQYSNNDVDIYNLACGYALLGRKEDALAQLERLAQRGSDYGAASDSDFDSLRSDPRFHVLLTRMQY
jgi:tetratricopeptide (TPR) repeat protein